MTSGTAATSLNDTVPASLSHHRSSSSSSHSLEMHGRYHPHHEDDQRLNSREYSRVSREPYHVRRPSSSLGHGHDYERRGSGREIYYASATPDYRGPVGPREVGGLVQPYFERLPSHGSAHHSHAQAASRHHRGESSHLVSPQPAHLVHLPPRPKSVASTSLLTSAFYPPGEQEDQHHPHSHQHHSSQLPPPPRPHHDDYDPQPLPSRYPRRSSGPVNHQRRQVSYSPPPTQHERPQIPPHSVSATWEHSRYPSEPEIRSRPSNHSRYFSPPPAVLDSVDASAELVRQRPSSIHELSPADHAWTEQYPEDVSPHERYEDYHPSGYTGRRVVAVHTMPDKSRVFVERHHPPGSSPPRSTGSIVHTEWNGPPGSVTASHAHAYPPDPSSGLQHHPEQAAHLQPMPQRRRHVSPSMTLTRSVSGGAHYYVSGVGAMSSRAGPYPTRAGRHERPISPSSQHHPRWHYDSVEDTRWQDEQGYSKARPEHVQAHRQSTGAPHVHHSYQYHHRGSISRDPTDAIRAGVTSEYSARRAVYERKERVYDMDRDRYEFDERDASARLEGSHGNLEENRAPHVHYTEGDDRGHGNHGSSPASDHQGSSLPTPIPAVRGRPPQNAKHISSHSANINNTSAGNTNGSANSSSIAGQNKSGSGSSSTFSAASSASLPRTADSTGSIHQSPNSLSTTATTTAKSPNTTGGTALTTSSTSATQQRPMRRGPYLSRQRAILAGLEGASPTSRYQCMYCQKRFSRPSSLRIHTYSHTGERPFQCSEEGCGRQFSVQSNMRRHLRVHRMAKNPFDASNDGNQGSSGGGGGGADDGGFLDDEEEEEDSQE